MQIRNKNKKFVKKVVNGVASSYALYFNDITNNFKLNTCKFPAAADVY